MACVPSQIIKYHSVVMNSDPPHKFLSDLANKVMSRVGGPKGPNEFESRQQYERHRSLAIRLLDKAAALCSTNYTFQHFVYASLIGLRSYGKAATEDQLASLEVTCRKQIAIAQFVAKEMADQRAQDFERWQQLSAGVAKREHLDMVRGSMEPAFRLPGHSGYEMLYRLLVDSNRLSEAISLASEAALHGWAGTWQKKIERLARSKRGIG